jgi:carbamoyltransferase
MNVLGLAGPFWHDPSAALLVDGRVVAAIEQERLSRRKHANGALPVEAALACLELGGLRVKDVELFAFPWSMQAIRAQRLRYARQFSRRPAKSLSMFVRGWKKSARRENRMLQTLARLGVDPDRAPLEWVEHHLAHASSAVHFSGFEDCAVLTVDGVGEITTCLFGCARGGAIEKLQETLRPDSLGFFYAAMTDFLGFEINDGEYKVMGMSSYGDPSKVDLSGLVRVEDGELRIDERALNPRRGGRWRGRSFGPQLVEKLGPPREGDEIDEPYIHIAAATQRVLEQAVLALVDHWLRAELERTRRLCFAGGVALNVVLNRRLMEHPLVDELFVPPSPNDAGTSLGAASFAAARRGERIAPLANAYLGPAYATDAIARELDELRIPYTRVPDAPARAAELLAGGEAVAWFQGRMEWGPRALGNRSILGHPGHAGTADDINGRIKYRERWRPFCPSVLEERAAEFLGRKHPSPFMTLSFRVPEEWRSRAPEVVHVDGTVRPQVVSKRENPRYHRLISEFERRTGLPCVLNTSLNRRGEPMIESPRDALAMFFGSGLEHLFLEDLYVGKRPR